MTHLTTIPRAAVAARAPRRCGDDRRRVLILTLITGLAVALSTTGSLADTWTDSTGQFKIEAEFVGAKDGKVYLKKADGITIAVPFARLSAESQQLARKLAGAPAPGAPAADTADAAMRAVIADLQTGNLRGVWDALPASYQKDLNDVVHTFAENMDAEVWTTTMSAVSKARLVLKQKKEFILAHPLLAALPNKDALAANWDQIVDVLDAVMASELAKLGTLKTIEVGEFIDGSGKKIVEKLAALAQNADQAGVKLDSFPGLPVKDLPIPTKAKVTLVSSDGDTAKVRFEEEGKEPKEVDMVRFEGKWLPREMVDGWADGVQQAKAKLTDDMAAALKKNKGQLLFQMKMLIAVCDQLLAARTQEQFNQTVNDIVGMFAMAFGAGRPGGPPASGGFGTGPSNAPPGGVKP